jgi:hypothetical protein
MERRATLSSAKREIERIGTRIKTARRNELRSSKRATSCLHDDAGAGPGTVRHAHGGDGGAPAPHRDAIILTPTQGELRIELKGNLAAMLSAATNAKRSPETGDLSLQVEIGCGGGI